MEHEALKKELAQCNTDHEACQSDARSCHADADACQSDLSGSKTRVGDLTDQNNKLNDRLASLVKDKAQLDASVEDMQSALKELQKAKAAADARINEFRALVGRFQSLIDAGKLRVKIVDGRMIVELATDILFSSGSARLSKEGKAAIAEVAQILTGIKDRRFQVEGHTDDVPMKGSTNWDLAADRAIAVVLTMTEAGMPTDRVSAASFGEYRPTRPNDSAEGKQANRRIEIVIMPDLSSLPGFDELERMTK